MTSRKSNLWPFSRSRKAVSHKPARRSSMTVGESTRAAYRAGKASGDTGLFQEWLEKQGLSTRGNVLVRRLKMEYERGVIEPASAPAPKKSVFRTVIHKGVKITPTEQGFVTALDSSEFETVTDAKRFIDAWKKNPTDRALRYRANQTPPEGEKICAFCGGKRTIEIGHVDGHEEHGEPDNLTWTCRSCNVIAGNTLRKAGKGRKTHQYNPTKSGGAATVGEWMRAVGSIVPHKGARYAGDNYGLVAAMPVHEAVAMIRATPQAKRSQFASQLRRHNPTAKATARGTLKAYDDISGGIYKYTAGLPSTLGHALLNPDWDQLIRQAETSHSVDELARLHKYAIGARHRELQDAVEVRAKKMNISIAKLTAKHPRKWNGKKNPEGAADALYESFHGKPAEETVEIREEIHEHLHLATLGQLRELVVDTMSGLRATIRFEKEPFLASSEDGRQLYIEAGDQELDLEALKMDGEEWVRDRMVIGQFSPPEPGATDKNGKRYWNISYQTRKKFDKFELVDYQHDLGEETGVRPFLEYEPRNQHLYISGGQYRIEQPLLDMSPGIEN